MVKTVAARRNARIRAAALATVPVILFVIAAVPRVWAPDLVPFASRQGALVASAHAQAAPSLLTIYTDVSLPPLALLGPLLRLLPAPIETWVVVRGLLDAVGVALLYLAARPIVGVIASSHGSPIAAPAPRSSVRRDIGFVRIKFIVAPPL